MKNHFINTEIFMCDFLKFLDKPFENGFDNGDIAFSVENYTGKEITAKELYNSMIDSHFGCFGVTYTISEFVEQMNIEIVEQNGNHFVLFQLAPFLGLSNNNWREELKELKNFLGWIKEEAINNPEYKVKLSFIRVAENVDFSIISESKLFQEELNKKMNEKIENSLILTQWVANQKKSFKEVEKQCYDLWISIDSLSLMSMEEQIKVLNARPKSIKPREIKINQKKRKNKF